MWLENEESAKILRTDLSFRFLLRAATNSLNLTGEQRMETGLFFASSASLDPTAPPNGATALFGA